MYWNKILTLFAITASVDAQTCRRNFECNNQCYAYSAPDNCPGCIPEFDVIADLRNGSFTGSHPSITVLTPLTQWSSGNECAYHGKLKLTFPQPSSLYNQKRVRIDLWYGELKGHTLDIGDSPTVNGYGGDAGTTSNGAEVHVVNQYLLIYGNVLPGYMPCTQDGHIGIYGDTNFIRNETCPHVTITIGDEYVEFDNHAGIHKVIQCPWLFTLRNQCTTYGNVNYDVYVGFNQVVTGTSSRQGSGLCRAAISWIN